MNLDMKQSWEYCQQTLPLVSRTFAINIGVLRGNLHRSTLLVYLACRIIDTVEDAPSLSGTTKVHFLRRFPKIVTERGWEPLLQRWIDDLMKEGLDGASHDVNLLRHSMDVVGCFKELPSEYQRGGERLFGIMANGMADYIERFPDNRIALVDVNDLEQYCYYVAGVVGEFLQEAFYEACKSSIYRSKKFRELCVSHGLGLQITNIAKDIFKDYQRGQRYFPYSFLQAASMDENKFLGKERTPEMLEAYKLLLQQAHSRLNDGYKLVKMIHRRHVRIRLFCLWPLWMAFETLKTLSQNMNLLYSPEDAKINRRQVKKILRTTTLIASSNYLLERNYSKNYKYLFKEIV